MPIASGDKYQTYEDVHADVHPYIGRRGTSLLLYLTATPRKRSNVKGNNQTLDINMGRVSGRRVPSGTGDWLRADARRTDRNRHDDSGQNLNRARHQSTWNGLVLR